MQKQATPEVPQGLTPALNAFLRWVRDRLKGLAVEKAQEAADNASSKAGQAQDTADSATGAAARAQETADGATNAAAAAQNTADKGVTDAAKAQGKADDAYGLAGTANETANTALDNADAAQERADEAYALAQRASKGAVRWDKVQNITASGQAQARENIDAAQDVMATTSTAGQVIIGTGLNVDASGVTSLSPANATSLGGVIIGTGISVDSNGVISVSSGSSGSSYVLPPATTTSLGGVIVGTGLGVTSAGKISVAGSYATSAAASNIASEIVEAGGFLTEVTSAAVISALGYTPPQSDTNTTYSSGTASQLSAGTDTTQRVWTPKVLSSYIAGATVASAGTATNATKLGNVAAGSYALKSDIPTVPTYSGASGVTLSGTTFSHTKGEGWGHVPSGGATNNVLVYSAAGAAKWAAMVESAQNATNASTVNSHTVSADVPADAAFTDHIYTHPTTEGYKHIPAGGASGQVLVYSAAGTAKWSSIVESAHNATSAGTAENASSLNGVVASNYVTRNTSQNITAAKTFASGITVSNGVEISGGATVNGNLTLQGGNGNIYVSATGSAANADVYVINSAGRWGSLQATANGEFGLYDNTNSAWVVRCNSAGDAYFNGGAEKLASGRALAVQLGNTYDPDNLYIFDGTEGRIAIPVRGTLPQSNGGTGASSRLGAVKALFNDNLSAGATSFLCVASNWASAGFASVDNAKAALGITAAGISSTLGTTAVASATNAGTAEKIGTATVGTTTKPVYISAGKPVSMAVVASATNAGTAASCTGNAATATTAASCTGNAATATNASSLGGIAAATYLRKDVASQLINAGSANGFIDLKTAGGTHDRVIRLAAQNNGRAGLYYNLGSGTTSAGWLINIEPNGTFLTKATAADASSLGGIAAASYVQKTANIQRGSAALYTSGATVNAGAITSKTITFGSAFGGSTPHVMAVARGAANSYVAGQNVAVQSRTASNCVVVVRNTYSNAVTTSAASYIDWVAVYF